MRPKKKKNRNESRIRYLERMLKTAIIVEDHSKADEVGLNNTVEIYCEDDDEVESYRIVTSVRGSSLNGLVSIESPIGKALLGHKEGDRVYVKVNDDYGYYVVIRKVIKTESEDADQIRSFRVLLTKGRVRDEVYNRYFRSGRNDHGFRPRDHERNPVCCKKACTSRNLR